MEKKMKNLKRLVALTLAGTLAFGVAGCGSTDTASKDSSENGTVYRTLDEIKESGT